MDNAVKKIEINHVISLGSSCHTAFFMKENKLKFYSLPFDWIFSGPMIVKNIIDDDFINFLDATKYTSFNNDPNRCGHTDYGKRFFNHKNPMNEHDYQYYVRTVERFKIILATTGVKLFIITNINTDSLYDNKNKALEKEYVGQLNDTLKKMVAEYYLLHIELSVIPLSEQRRYTLEINNNVYFLTVYLYSESDGIRFKDIPDNIYFSSVFNELFLFDNVVKIDPLVLLKGYCEDDRVDKVKDIGEIKNSGDDSF